MAKIKSIYSCTECGATSPKWQGQCPGCGEWNTLVESVAEKASAHRFESLAPVARLRNLAEIEARETERIPTGIAEFDRALGGGSLLGGDRGADQHAVLPGQGLVDQRHVGRAPPAEQDRRDRHAGRVLPLGSDRGALRGRCGEAGVGVRRRGAA